MKTFPSSLIPLRYKDKGKVQAMKSIDLSGRTASELIIKELSELEAGKGIWSRRGLDM